MECSTTQNLQEMAAFVDEEVVVETGNIIVIDVFAVSLVVPLTAVTIIVVSEQIVTYLWILLLVMLMSIV